MKTITAIIVSLIFLLAVLSLAESCYAQSIAYAPYVGGEYGRLWLDSLGHRITAPAQSTYSDLWYWGGGPKGSIAVNGYLLPDLRYTWKSENGTGYWTGGKPPYASRWYPPYSHWYPYSFGSLYPGLYYYPPGYLYGEYVVRRLY
ncbi:MAG: hypothetical protein IPI63_11540 [Methanothrix sp.]|uniref:hypothetical protein n=1 Tax=Methanothrix sp. TaxID=90426 RepID=UPI0025FC0229|nr:hypothetical protein [Methanothrix sp.]MBK7387305.1 hypothetical protein [Methanothrix sp.]